MPSTALTSAEISLPGVADTGRVRERIATLADTVDLVGLTDNHAGQPRMSPLAAVALAREQGVRTVVHVSCRDRNRLALQSQVVGAAALGLARRAMEEACAWVTARQVFGKALAEHQMTQARLAEMAVTYINWSISDPKPRLDRRVAGLGFRLYGWEIGLNGEVFANDVGADPSQPWLLSFWFGGWDCDALCAYMKGTLETP